MKAIQVRAKTGTKAGTKQCQRCKGTFPTDAAHYRHDKSQKDGFGVYCISCSKHMVNRHYVGFSDVDIKYQGEQGVLCPLWSPKCGVCTVLADCWRIAKINPNSIGYPNKLSE